MCNQTFWAIANIDPTDIEYVKYKINTADIIDLQHRRYMAINFSTKEYARQWFIQTCRPDN
jgi:hypothetical protein